MADIKNLNPVEIWRNFDKLTQVPRPSGHLEKFRLICSIGQKKQV